jgi:hypothetical protein
MLIVMEVDNADTEFKIGSYYKLILNNTRLQESFDIKQAFGKRADCENNGSKEVIYIIGQLVELPQTIPPIMLHISKQQSPKILNKYSEMKMYSETTIYLTLADGKSCYFPILKKGWIYSDAVEYIVEATYEDYNKSCIQFSKNKEFGAKIKLGLY